MHRRPGFSTCPSPFPLKPLSSNPPTPAPGMIHPPRAREPSSSSDFSQQQQQHLLFHQQQQCRQSRPSTTFFQVSRRKPPAQKTGEEREQGGETFFRAQAVGRRRREAALALHDACVVGTTLPGKKAEYLCARPRRAKRPPSLSLQASRRERPFAARRPFKREKNHSAGDDASERTRRPAIL